MATTKGLSVICEGIYLIDKIYNTWQILKYQGPYNSGSDFAVYLISLASMYVLFSFRFNLLDETFEFKERKTNC